jgi:hypothetical protein
MKSKPEYNEGPQAAQRFEEAMRRVLSVSHEEIQRRIAAEREQSALNPHKRGPKAKAKPSAS